MSLEDAKQKALICAQNLALGTASGYAVSELNTLALKNDGNKSTENFESLGSSEVKEEWLADERQPVFKTIFDDATNTTIITVQVWGIARPIEKATTDISVKILRNGTSPKCESDIFKNGDDLFLYFQSPVSGYVAVYLIDKLNTAYCLLPYSGDPDGKEQIKNNRNYVFFSPQLADQPALVDEYTLTCDDEVENNYIYVIFSPNEFAKANDAQTNSTLPRQLSFSDFNKWIQKCRQFDTRMVVVKRSISIQK